MGSKNIDFGLSNAVSDVFLRAFVIFVDMICDHHKKVYFWPVFQYDQFSNTVLGYLNVSVNTVLLERKGFILKNL